MPLYLPIDGTFGANMHLGKCCGTKFTGKIMGLASLPCELFFQNEMI